MSYGNVATKDSLRSNTAPFRTAVTRFFRFLGSQ
jgi:hypothetical protein